MVIVTLVLALRPLGQMQATGQRQARQGRSRNAHAELKRQRELVRVAHLLVRELSCGPIVALNGVIVLFEYGV